GSQFFCGVQPRWSDPAGVSSRRKVSAATDTPMHHLRCGNYARWFREAIKDDRLAAETEGFQQLGDPVASRRSIREAPLYRPGRAAVAPIIPASRVDAPGPPSFLSSPRGVPVRRFPANDLRLLSGEERRIEEELLDFPTEATRELSRPLEFSQPIVP